MNSQTNCKGRMENLSRQKSHEREQKNPLQSWLVHGESQRGKEEGESEPVIIGGMVLDIHATPSIPANPRTTTPGKVRYAVGGVARNIAECVSKLGTKPYMISALGLDMAGNLLLEHWRSAGLSIEGIQRCGEIETAVVCNIFDVEGELAAAVASVESIERFLTPKWIARFKSNIESAPILMVDANLSPPALEAACQLAAVFDTPVWFEPVSVAKSRRVASVVKHITFASPNEDELTSMANALSCKDAFLPLQKDNGTGRYSIESLFQMLKPAICVLLEKGIKIVVLTLGSNGVLLCSTGHHTIQSTVKQKNKSQGSSQKLYETVNFCCPPDRFLISSSRTEENFSSSSPFVVHFPAVPSASVVRLTGAGDCLVGGIMASLCSGLDIMQSIAVGVAAAKAAVEVETNVPAEYSLAKIADGARSVYFGSKVLMSRSRL